MQQTSTFFTYDTATVRLARIPVETAHLLSPTDEQRRYERVYVDVLMTNNEIRPSHELNITGKRTYALLFNQSVGQNLQKISALKASGVKGKGDRIFLHALKTGTAACVTSVALGVIGTAIFPPAAGLFAPSIAGSLGALGGLAAGTDNAIRDENKTTEVIYYIVELSVFMNRLRSNEFRTKEAAQNLKEYRNKAISIRGSALYAFDEAIEMLNLNKTTAFVALMKEFERIKNL